MPRQSARSLIDCLGGLNKFYIVALVLIWKWIRFPNQMISCKVCGFSRKGILYLQLTTKAESARSIQSTEVSNQNPER